MKANKLLDFLQNLLICWLSVVFVLTNEVSCETVVSLSYDPKLNSRVNDVINEHSGSHGIYKRASDSQSCPTLEEQAPGLPSDLTTASTTHRFKAPSDGNTDYNAITMVWTGEHNATRVVGLIDTDGDVDSTVYQSKENTNSFIKSTGLEGVTISVMDTNPAIQEHVIIIGKKDQEYQSCVSANSGVSFECHVMLTSYIPAGTLIFKAHMVLTIMKSESYYENELVLVLSKDYGKSWTLIHRNVKVAVFQPNKLHRILAMVSVEDSSPFAGFGFNFFGSTSISQIKKINVDDDKAPTSSYLEGLKKASVTGFQYVGDFLHVVTPDEDGHKVLKVSKDDGVTFTDTHLPSATTDQYINILHTAEDLIFTHVTDPNDENSGVLYTSGKDGLFYSTSLTNHINDDFYAVSSMHGVYISTQQQLDGSLVSKISLDRGADWGDITLKGCQQSVCTIQIYNKFLIEHHMAFTQEILAQSPHSNKNARGLIVVQGVIAESIPYNPATKRYNYEADKVFVFISGDGGYSWVLASDTLVGAHRLLIEDSGGIIQALPINKQLEHIHFSVDEGKCWYELPINQNNITKNFTIKAIVSQPGQKSLKIGIIGHGQENANQISWLIIDVDFNQIISRKCGTEGDLEEWDDHPSCYLGVRRTYMRVKKRSWCYLGPKANVSYTTSTCACTRKDYECDYGYVRQEDDKRSCVKDSKFKDEVTYCLDNKVYQLISSGYRKVPGGQCEINDPKSVVMNTEVKTKDMELSCDQGDPDTYLSLDVVKKRICESETASAAGNTGGNGSKNKGLVAGIALLTLLCTVLCAVLGVMYIRYKKLQRQFDYGTFDNSPWEADRGNSSAAAPSVRSETAQISKAGSAGKSYSRLKESGVESDADLLNM